MQRSLPATVLVAAVLLAGCTGLQDGQSDTGQERSVTVTPNDGLSISFTPQINRFRENQVLQYKVAVENTGEATAENIQVTPIGGPLTSDGRCTPSPISDRIGTSLARSDAELGRPGGKVSFNWKCFAPLGDGSGSKKVINLPAGATDRFDAGLRFTYDYTTEATAEVTFAIPSRFQQSSRVATDNSAGPVKADILLQSPRSFPNNPAKFEIPIRIRNVGDGQIKDSNVKLALAIDGQNVIGDVDSPSSSGMSVSVVNGRRQITIDKEFITRSSGGNPFSMLPAGNADQTTVPITVALSYTYEEETLSQYTVTGQPANVKVETPEQAVSPGRGLGPGRVTPVGDVSFLVKWKKEPETAQYSVTIKRASSNNGPGPIKATIASGTGFTEECDKTEAEINIYEDWKNGRGALLGRDSIRQNNRFKQISDAAGYSNSELEVVMKNWECRSNKNQDNQLEEPFQLGCLPPARERGGNITITAGERKQIAYTCFKGEVEYTADVVYGGGTLQANGNPVSDVSIKIGTSKSTPPVSTPSTSYKGSEIGKNFTFTASVSLNPSGSQKSPSCPKRKIHLIAGKRGQAKEIQCTDAAIDLLEKNYNPSDGSQ